MFLRDTSDDDLSSDENDEAWLKNIVERARAREQKAFRILFDLYNAKICTYLSRQVHNESTARDLAQNVFIKAWEKLPDINNPSCFTSWLYKIATNEAHRHIRRVRQTESFPMDEWECSARQEFMVSGPEKQVEEAELIKCMLARLSFQDSTMK